MTGLLAKFLRSATVVTVSGITGGLAGNLTNEIKDQKEKLPVTEEEPFETEIYLDEATIKEIKTREVKAIPETRINGPSSIVTCQELEKIKRKKLNERQCKRMQQWLDQKIADEWGSAL